MLADLIYQFLVIPIVALFYGIPRVLYGFFRYGKYRHGWDQKLFGLAPELPPVPEGKKRLWLHGVSVGEIALLQPLVDEIAKSRPDWEFVVSATTDTGYELANKLFSDRARVFYCPFDMSWTVRRAVARIKPDMLVLVELEIWPGLIKAVHDSGARVAIVNGRLSEHSFKGYRRLQRLRLLSPTFRRIDLVAAQDGDSETRFKKLSPCPERVLLSGSLKFDGVRTDRQNAKTRELAALAGIEENDVVFLAGSTQDPEEAAALETYRRLYRDYPALKLILVPRHPQRFEEVAQLLEKSEFAWTRRSALADAPTPAVPGDAAPEKDPRRLLLVDTIGELGAWWGTSQIAFVGGSWGKREGQNMLEPSGYGAAVSFGPRTKNFRRIVELLLAANGAVVVKDPDEMAAFVRRCLDDVPWREKLGAAARSLVLNNAGATRRTVGELARLLEDAPSSKR